MKKLLLISIMALSFGANAALVTEREDDVDVETTSSALHFGAENLDDDSDADNVLSIISAISVGDNATTTEDLKDDVDVETTSSGANATTVEDLREDFDVEHLPALMRLAQKLKELAITKCYKKVGAHITKTNYFSSILAKIRDQDAKDEEELLLAQGVYMQSKLYTNFINEYVTENLQSRNNRTGQIKHNIQDYFVPSNDFQKTCLLKLKNDISDFQEKGKIIDKDTTFKMPISSTAFYKTNAHFSEAFIHENKECYNKYFLNVSQEEKKNKGKKKA